MAGEVQEDVIVDTPSSAPATTNVRNRFIWLSLAELILVTTYHAVTSIYETCRAIDPAWLNMCAMDQPI